MTQRAKLQTVDKTPRKMVVSGTPRISTSKKITRMKAKAAELLSEWKDNILAELLGTTPALPKDPIDFDNFLDNVQDESIFAQERPATTLLNKLNCCTVTDTLWQLGCRKHHDELIFQQHPLAISSQPPHQLLGDLV